MWKLYVEFMYSVGSDNECRSQEITRNDILVEIPENAIGYRFYGKNFVEKDGKILEEEPSNFSGWKYKGKRMTYEDIIVAARRNPELNTLLLDMEKNGISAVVKVGNNNYIPLKPEDTVY